MRISQKGQLQSHLNINENIKRIRIKKLRKNLTQLKQPRQKFCPRWETEFPWLKADRIDESIGICMVCKTELVCKKSHLERHQKSFKHMRLKGFQNPLNIKEQSENPYLEDVIDYHPYEENAKESSNENIKNNKIEIESAKKIMKFSQIENSKTKSKRRNFTTNEKFSTKKRSLLSKCSRMELLKRIDQERKELDEYLQKQRTSPMHMHNQHISRMPNVVVVTQKDSCDLFFESMSCTVKALPPRLAAEIKSKISQIVAEFELRAISERE